MSQITEMQKQIVDTFNEYDRQGTVHWTYDIAATDLQYQIGNLTKAILQLRGFRYAEGLTPEEIKHRISDELADIMAEVLFIAHELDINMEQAWDTMLKSDKTKIDTRSQT